MKIFEKNAKKALAQVGADFGIPSNQQYLEIGYVKKAVIELAKKIHADLIVIGSHGRHGVQLLLGSTANAILHTADCDVLAVRIEE